MPPIPTNRESERSSMSNAFSWLQCDVLCAIKPSLAKFTAGRRQPFAHFPIPTLIPTLFLISILHRAENRRGPWCDRPPRPRSEKMIKKVCCRVREQLGLLEDEVSLLPFSAVIKQSLPRPDDIRKTCKRGDFTTPHRHPSLEAANLRIVGHRGPFVGVLKCPPQVLLLPLLLPPTH